MSLIASLITHLEDAQLWQKEIVLKRNDFLLMEGQTDTHLYFVKNGTLRVFMTDDGIEHTIRFGYQNDLITALDSFVNDDPSHFSIQALKATELKSISKSVFIEFIQSTTERTHLWVEVLGALVHQQIEREFDLLTASPIKRYERVKVRSPQLFQEVPLKYIASYLRMAPETLSRIRAGLKK